MLENTEGDINQSMNNPENLARQQNKSTTQYMYALDSSSCLL